MPLRNQIKVLLMKKKEDFFKKNDGLETAEMDEKSHAEEPPLSSFNAPDSADEIDSLSAYMKELGERELLSPEEELELTGKYREAKDAVWESLCNFGFTANEYLNILDGINSENICDEFMILNVVKEKQIRPDSFLPVFAKWKLEIAALYEKLKRDYSGKSAKTKDTRASLVRSLKKFRPQNSFIEEWIEAALEYNSLLNKKREKGKIIDHIRERLLLDESEFVKILKAALRGREEADNIRKRIVECNLRLVISIAKRFQNRGLPLSDMIQDGNMGLMKALEKFDCRLGHKFSTYATWWIKHSVSRGLAEQSRTIRIPVHMLATISKIFAGEQRFIQEKGREPAYEELAAIMDMPKERIRALQRMASQTVSLESPIGGDGDSTIKDLIPDEGADNPVQKAAYTMLKEKISEAIDTLTEREQQIISMHFGLFSEPERTLAEISKHFGITTERVRQIEAKAFEKLRCPGRREFLEGY